ncbi:MAG TPA: PAS domain S-box protein [Gammaproteobacteria bacterium]|nr:PAS domain S-box protein [Gammaproteobacteria bacterium]
MLVSPLRSLRVRLIVSVVVIEVVMLSLLVWSNLGVIQQAHADRLWDTATSMLEQIATTSGGYLVEVDYATLEEYLQNIAQHDELDYLVVLDRDQRPIVTLGQAPRPPWPDTETEPLEVSDGVLDVSGDIRIGGQLMGEVRLGFSLAQMEKAIDAARLRSIAIAITEITLTILATVFIGVHLTRRLGRLANAAHRVGSGDYSVSVDAEIRDEVGMTAMAFNRMVEEVSRRTRHLQEALARERVIEATAIDGMVTYGAAGTILSVNPAMEALFGYSEQELVGQPVAMLLEAVDAETWEKPTGSRIEATGVRKDGHCFPLELYIGHVDINGEALYAATLHDITERKRAERECMTLLEGNRFLIHKSLAVQEEERRNLARELHDELGQCMTAIQADAENIRDLSASSNTRIETSASAILSVSARIYDVVHSMMQRLRPSVLDDLGLVAALEEEISAWQARHPDIDFSFTNAGDLSALGEAINISIYRIVQESLTNISKHADAGRVSIRMAVQQQDGKPCVVLAIEDNGRGMDPALRSRGLGLIGMRERIQALHGSLDIQSSPGKGLRIDAVIPLADNG